MKSTRIRSRLRASAVLFLSLFAAQAALLVLSPILPQVADEFSEAGIGPPVGTGAHELTSGSQWLARRRWTVRAMAIALAGIMTVNVVVTGEVFHSREAGTFRDGPEAADVLLDVIEAGDRIVVESHPRPVLDYYLRRGGWAGPELQRDYQNADRLFVVVYHPRPQDLSGVLTKVPVADFTTPRLLTRLDETDIYVMERTASHPPTYQLRDFRQRRPFERARAR